MQNTIHAHALDGRSAFRPSSPIEEFAAALEGFKTPGYLQAITTSGSTHLAGWHTRLIRQRSTYDCGVACAAMATHSAYSEALAAFYAQGLYQKPRPLVSNGKQLSAVISKLHFATRSIKWNGWDAFDGVGILKLRTGSERLWHWVVAERSSTRGVIVWDPAYAYPYLEHPIAGVVSLELFDIEPYGQWLAVDRPT